MAPCEQCQGSYLCLYSDYDMNCSSRQNYCRINGQTLNDNLTEVAIDNNYPLVSKDTAINYNDIDKAMVVLYRAYLFGTWRDNNGGLHGRGTPNPQLAKMENWVTNYRPATDSYALLNSYNGLLDVMGNTTNKLTAGTLLSKTVMDNLHNIIKAYNLNYDRCWTCNSSSNAGASGCTSQGSSGNSCGCYCTGYQCVTCDSSFQGGCDPN